jgi:hypothetical protein
MRDAATRDHNRMDFTDFNITIKKLLKCKLGEGYRDSETRKKTELRVYIMWK